MRGIKHGYIEAPCRKVRYNTRKYAWKGSVDVFKTTRRKLGAYKCKRCRGFHLSRQVAIPLAYKDRYNETI